jgi:hypothetical protein
MARTTRTKAAATEVAEVETPAGDVVTEEVAAPTEVVEVATAEEATEAIAEATEGDPEAAAETGEPVEEEPSESVLLLDAGEIDADVKAAWEAVNVFVRVASLDHAPTIEFRAGSNGIRGRMACPCGRHSYFADVTEADGKPVLPAPVKAALIRHAKRAQGKAMQVIKNSPDLLAAVKSLPEVESAESTPAEPVEA